MSRIIKNPQQLILSKAKEILYNEGYLKLTMRNISKECDIALGTIYNYYPTKKELLIEMMTDYWRDYFYRIKDIKNLDIAFYNKLNKIFNELSYFIKTFKEIWLKPELYEKPDYVEGGLKKETIYIERLILFIESIIIMEIDANNIEIKLDTYETSKFIIMNFITIIQMPVFKYSSFEVILKKILNN